MGRYVVGTSGLRVKYAFGVQKSDLAWLALRSGAGTGALALSYALDSDDLDATARRAKGLGPGSRGSFETALVPDPHLDLELVPHAAFGAAMDAGWLKAAAIAKRFSSRSVAVEAKGTFSLRRRDWSKLAAWIGRFVGGGPPLRATDLRDPAAVRARLRARAGSTLPGMALEILAHAVTKQLDLLEAEDEDSVWSATLLPIRKQDRARVAELLHEAVCEGRPGDVASLLALGLDPNTRDENGDTPLAVAAREGHAAIVDLLLEAGAKRSERSGGYPLLHHAAQGGLVRLTRKLLDEGQDPNLRADDGDTPLIDAAFGGHATTVALLLKRGADPTLANKKRRTALSYAKNAAVKALITAALKGRAPAHSRPRARRASTRA
ncbi:MAG: ankyrin repeat domain-containing protein [Polyangiaceae bacterium]